MELNKTWEIVDLPADKTLISCKWVYKIKYKYDDSIDTLKDRLVAKEYTQKAGIRCFSPVTIQTILGWAAMNQ